MAASATARLRFLYALNVLVPGGLALTHLLAPSLAAEVVWGGHAKPSLPLAMCGSWWAAIALLSAAGLRSPLKYSPVALLQIVYKLVFLSSTILPRLAEGGRWGDVFPPLSTALYTAYLPLLLVCTPWGYLLGGSDGMVESGTKKEA